MKKIIIFSALALVALASCTKKELDTPNQEISYQVIATKAATALGTDKAFYSYSFLEQESGAWASLSESDYLPYFADSKITHNTDKWNNATKTYYWPKDANSSLVFYAWTDNTITKTSTDVNDKLGITVNCSAKGGITFTNYEVEENYTRNKDLQVADKQADQKNNSAATYGFTGVTTVFKHKLSTFVLKAKTNKEYNGVTFFIKDITFNKVANKGNYSQNASGTESWTSVPETPTTRSYRMFTADYVNGGIITTTEDVYGTKLLGTNTTGITLEPSTLAGGGDFTILLPQTLANEDGVNVTINYDIVTENIPGKPVRETVTETKKLKSIFTDDWKIGKKYVLEMIFSMDEILWDPATEDWDEVSGLEWNM